MANDGLKKEAIDKSKSLARDAGTIAKCALWVYPLCIFLFSVGGCVGAYTYVATNFGDWWALLGALLGLGFGGICGFFAGGIVVASMVDDLVFDASWSSVKLGFKALRGKKD